MRERCCNTCFPRYTPPLPQINVHHQTLAQIIPFLMKAQIHKKSSEIIHINNNIDTLQSTFDNIKKLAASRTFEIKPFKIELLSYAEQYVSGLQRDAFFGAFCEHNIVEFLLDLIKKRNDPDLFTAIMKSLSVISFNLKETKEVAFFFSRPALNDLIEIQFPENSTSDTVEVYIQFLKSLALRLKENNIWMLFFNQKQSLFPLLWKVLMFYNHNDQLTRTTIRAILLEISKIKDFSVKCYLNNFPFVLFFGHLAMYITDHMRECTGKYSETMVDFVADQLNFVNDLISRLETSTKSFLLNALIYYPFRLIWTEIGRDNQNESIRTILWLILALFFNLNSDPNVLELIHEIYFRRYITPETLDFLNTKPKDMKFYSLKEEKPKIQNCRAVIEKHCQKVYNRFDTEVCNTADPLPTKAHYKPNSLIDKPLKLSKQILSKVLTPWSWDGWLIEEMNILSEVIGTDVRLNQPISHYINDNNIYLQCKEMKFETSNKVENPFYRNLMQIVKEDAGSLNLLLKGHCLLLNNPLLKQIHPQVVDNFMLEVPHLLGTLWECKSVDGMVYAMQIFELCQQLTPIGRMSELVQKAKQTLNQLISRASQSLLESEFTDWENYLEVFQGHERCMEKFRKENYRKSEISYRIPQQEVIVSDQQLQIHFYSMMRMIITSLKEDEGSRVQDIVAAMEESHLKALEEPLSMIPLFINRNPLSVTVKNRVITISNGRPILEGYTKQMTCNLIEDDKLELCVLPNRATVEFSSAEARTEWLEQVSALNAKVEETEIKIISALVENPPLI